MGLSSLRFSQTGGPMSIHAKSSAKPVSTKGQSHEGWEPGLGPLREKTDETGSTLPSVPMSKEFVLILVEGS